MFYDINLGELRVSSVGAIFASDADDTTLIAEQRDNNIVFWKKNLESKWFFDVQAEQWVYVVCVSFDRHKFRRKGSSDDFADIIVDCIQDSKRFHQEVIDNPDFYLCTIES
jgi:hypothetical protein